MIKLNNPLKIIALILSALYPFCIFFALQREISLRWLSLFLLVLILSAFLRSQQKIILFVGLLLIALLLLFDSKIFLKLYPVCMNTFVCFSFWLSLNNKPLVTVFAEKMGKTITPDIADYTRKVTVAWGIFMTLNTLISAITLLTPMWLWTLYNGLISYFLMGLMFIGEYLIRRRQKHESI